jgi:hypothetical protein
MKDTIVQLAMQEKNDKTPEKCFRGLKRAAYQGSTLRRPAVHRFRQRDILRWMPGSIQALQQTHTYVRAAITHRQPIAALYRGRRRLLCPHLLGWNKHRRLLVLCYQYGGESESGLQPAGAPDNWRCLAIEHLSQVELLDDPWQSAENHSRPQRCFEEVELDVDDYPERVPPAQSPNPKSAKL